MIISIDTETQGLNTHNFLVGCICHENMKTELYHDKGMLWDRIMALGEKCRKKKETLLIYAHNMQYDYYVVRPREQIVNFYLYSMRPFIVDARDPKNKNRIFQKYLSTTSLWRGSLEELGTAMQFPKLDMPEWLKKSEHETNVGDLMSLHPYVTRDTVIVMKYVQTLKKWLKKRGINTRWLLTAAQVGINGLQSVLKGYSHHEAFWSDSYTRQFHMTAYPDFQHEALRGGRVEAFKTGQYTTCTHIDINGHYPHTFSECTLPDLRTETFLERPLEHYTLSELFATIGLSQCLIRLPEGCAYGVLPLRYTTDDTIYPTAPGQLLIGSWTHIELAEAVKRGYEVLHITQSITYETLADGKHGNPWKAYLEGLLQEKAESTDELEKHFFKMLLNGGIGKFAQRREQCEYLWKPIEETEDMLRQGWQSLDTLTYNRLFERVVGMNYPRYYAPIINSLITGHARIRLLECMEKIEPELLCYVDTDGLIFKDDGTTDVLQRFKYSKNSGDMKVVTEKKPIRIYGKKSYDHDGDIKLSGVGKAWTSSAAFADGYIRYPRMETEKTTPNPSTVGTFTYHTRDLHGTQAAHEALLDDTRQQKLLVDVKTDIQPFIPILTNLFPEGDIQCDHLTASTRSVPVPSVSFSHT